MSIPSRVAAFGVVAALLGASLAPAPALAQVAKPSDLVYPKLSAFTVPKPVRFVLPNGMVVMVMEDRELPLVNVVARVRTGSLLEPADKAGLASLTGQVLRTGGTTSMKPDQLDEFLEGRAAAIETGIGADSGSASMSALKADVPAVLKVFADVLRRPAFDADRFKVAVTGVTAAIARQNDSPNAILGREFAQVIFGEDSPFARQTTYGSIASITREDLAAWHAKYYHPNRVILGIVGDIGVDEAKKLVAEQFGDWPKGPAVTETFPTPRTTPTPGVFEAVKADSTQSFVSVGHQGELLRTNPDYYPVTVLNEVLSGGFTSRLFSKIRTELGLAYSVGGSVGSGWTRVAPLSMTMSTKVESTVDAVQALIKEAGDLRGTRPPTEAEVALAKSSILNSFVFNSDSAAEVLGQQMTYEYYGQPLDWLDRYRAAIEKVTVKEVAAVATKYIHPDRLTIVVVGPSEGHAKPLSTLGPVKPLDIAIPEPPSAKPAAGPASADATKKGRYLIDKAVAGLGGAAKVDGLTSLTERATVVMRTPQGEMEIKVVRIVAPPNRLRQEAQTPGGPFTVVVTPDAAFAITARGEQPLPPPMRDQANKDMLHTPVLLLRHRDDPAFKAAATGAGKAGETAVELVAVQFASDTVTLGIDPASGRVLTVAYRGEGPTGAPGDIVETLSDYRDVNGFMLPFKSASTFNGEPGTSSATETITVNAPVDAKQFQRATTP
jgi:zinc protease